MFHSVDSRQRIRHPGPASEPRKQWVRGAVQVLKFRLPAGQSLMQALRAVLPEGEIGAAFVPLAGLRLSAGHFVLPAASPDAQHVAWYSQTHEMGAVTFIHGTVVLGRKDGDWFAHCHALWADAQGGQAMGHVWCDDALIGEPWEAVVYLFAGGGLAVEFDPETRFSLMRPQDPDVPVTAANALLMTVKPHEDLRATLDEVCGTLGIRSAQVLGVGSLIGATFTHGPAMHAALSEIVLLPGAVIADGRCQALPVACVDPEAVIYQGDLRSGHGPILITCELLILQT